MQEHIRLPLTMLLTLTVGFAAVAQRTARGVYHRCTGSIGHLLLTREAHKSEANQSLHYIRLVTFTRIQLCRRVNHADTGEAPSSDHIRLLRQSSAVIASHNVRRPNQNREHSSQDPLHCIRRASARRRREIHVEHDAGRQQQRRRGRLTEECRKQLRGERRVGFGTEHGGRRRCAREAGPCFLCGTAARPGEGNGGHAELDGFACGAATSYVCKRQC